MAEIFSEHLDGSHGSSLRCGLTPLGHQISWHGFLIAVGLIEAVVVASVACLEWCLQTFVTRLALQGIRFCILRQFTVWWRWGTHGWSCVESP